MSDLIIRIDSQAVDLSTGQTIAITKQAAKVGDFSTVLANGTNEVTIPLTANNRLIMDNAHIMQSDSGKPYQLLDAQLVQEGYTTMQDGYAIIKTSSEDFSLQLLGGNAAFFSQIKDLRLRDLPLEQWDHFWTNQNVFALRNATDGMSYPLFDQSGDTDETLTTYGVNQYKVKTDLLLPCFYVHQLVYKIFTLRGYTFVTDISTDFIYTNLVVFNGGIPTRGMDMSYHNCTVRSAANQTINVAAIGNKIFASATVDANQSVYASNTGLLASLQAITDGRFLLTDPTTVTIVTVLNTDSAFSPNSMQLQVKHTTENGEVFTPIQTVVVGLGVNTYTLTTTFDVEAFNGLISFIPILFLQVGMPSLTLLQGSNYTVTVADLESASDSVVTPFFPSNFLRGFTPVPDITQGEFMKELARMFQWVFDTDETTHTVTARRFDNIKDRIPQAIDLSAKIDANKIKTTFGVDGFAQTNSLAYKPDDETKFDAVGYINVDDTTLKAKGKYVAMSTFAASSDKRRFDTLAVPYVPIFTELLPTNGMTDRIFLVKPITFPFPIDFNRDNEPPQNLTTQQVSLAYFMEAGNNDSLDFPTLIRRFYQTVIDMTFRGKSVECLVNLNIRDVVNYDPFTPVYVSHLGNYFYWEKLSNYVKGKLTKCKLVKI